MTMNMFKETVGRYGDFAGTPAVLKGMSGVSFDGGAQFEDFKGDMDVHNKALISAAPTAVFQSSDLKGMLDITSLDVDELDLTHKIELNWREKLDGGSYAGAGADVQALFNKGVLFPQTLNCQHGQICTLSMNVAGTWDGTTDPVTLAKNATAPAEVVQDYMFTLRAIKWGAAGALTMAQESLSLDFGFEVELKGSDGELFPSFASQKSRTPVLKIGSHDLAAAIDNSYKGVQDGTNDLIIYLARLQEGGSRYADNTSNHIKITIKKHHRSSKSIGETADVEFVPLWNGVNDIYTIDTAAQVV